MAASNKKESANTAKDRRRRLLWKLVLLLLVVIAALGGVYGFYYGAELVLFSGNERFRLRRIEVVSDGYWNKRAGLLGRELGLVNGRDNIFRLDMRKLRSGVAAFPGVEYCEIDRVLPDTLRFRIVERIPRGRLYRNEEFLIDESCVLIPREQCVIPYTELPLFAGCADDVRLAPGATLDSAKSAMKVLMTTIRDFPEMEIRIINASKADKIEFSMRFQRRSGNYLITIPGDVENLPMRLNALRSAILQSIREGDRCSRFEIPFDGQVIRRP